MPKGTLAEGGDRGEPTSVVKQRVEQARERSQQRSGKVARTIADLDGAPQIARPHLAEALGYRAMDRLLKQLTLQAV